MDLTTTSDAAPAPDVSGDEYRSIRPLWAEVSLSAITHNLQEVKRLVDRPVKVIAVVKADAYGLGVVPVGRHLEKLGVDGLATSNFDDAVALRRHGVKIPIILFASNLPQGVGGLLEHDLTPSLYNLETARALSAVATRPVNVHIKVDSGLGRLGVKFAEAREFIRTVSQLPNLRVEGVYSHIAFSNAAGAEWSRRRLTAFHGLIEQLEGEDGIAIDFAQVCASATIGCRFPDTLNTIAPGHALYGLHPAEKALFSAWNFKPALTSLKGALIHTARHRPGEDLAISGQYGLKQAMHTGVILFGLDNGFRMPVSEDAYVLCRGKRCRVLSVTLEYTVIDLADVDDARLGDEVTIIGRDGEEAISLDKVGDYMGVGALRAALDLRRLPISYLED